jgi:hypothetical protein
LQEASKEADRAKGSMDARGRRIMNDLRWFFSAGDTEANFIISIF